MDSNGNKTGGRQKGSLNKNTLNMADINRQVVELICDDRILGLAILIETLAKSKPEVLLNYIAKVMPKDINLSGTVKSDLELERELIRKNLTKEELTLMAELVKKARGQNGEQT